MEERERKEAIDNLVTIYNSYESFKALRKSVASNMYQNFKSFLQLNGNRYKIQFYTSRNVRIDELFIKNNTIYCSCTEWPFWGFSTCTVNTRRLDKIFGEYIVEKYLELSQVLLKSFSENNE